MLENRIKLNIITNRKLCENENLEKQIKKIFSAYEKKIILKNFEIVALTLREKDLDKNEYLNLVKKIYPICKKYGIDLILHQNYDLNLDEKYNIEGIHLSYEIFKSLNKNIPDERIILFLGKEEPKELLKTYEIKKVYDYQKVTHDMERIYLLEKIY